MLMLKPSVWNQTSHLTYGIKYIYILRVLQFVLKHVYVRACISCLGSFEVLFFFFFFYGLVWESTHFCQFPPRDTNTWCETEVINVMSGMKKGTESGRKTRERLSDRDRDRERDGATQRKRGFHPGVSPLFLKHGSHITQITQSGKPHTPHACVFFFLLRNISEYVTSQLDSSVVFRRVERVYRHGNV